MSIMETRGGYSLILTDGDVLPLTGVSKWPKSLTNGWVVVKSLYKWMGGSRILQKIPLHMGTFFKSTKNCTLEAL